MPGIPASALPALIGAGASLVGTGIDAIATGAQNRASRNYADMAYERSRADNIAFWQMQNDYNSPQAQMARFQAGGLNPNLIYGQSNTAGSINTPDTQTPQFRTPDFGSGFQSAGSFLTQIYDLEIKQAQVDNLRTQNTVLLEEAASKAAGTERAKYDLEFERELRETSADFRRENLRKLKAETEMSLSENERRAVLNSASLTESIERVLSMRLDRDKARATIESIKKDNVLKQLDIELRRMGINPNDSMFMRILGRIIGPILEDPRNLQGLLKKF